MNVPTLAELPGPPRRFASLEGAIPRLLPGAMRPLDSFRGLPAGSRLNAFQARTPARDRAAREMARLGPFPPGPFPR